MTSPIAYDIWVDCCVLCCWACTPLAAVRRRWTPWSIAFYHIFVSMFSYAHTSQVRQTQVRRQAYHLSDQISPPIFGRWGRFKLPSSAHVCWDAGCMVLKRIWTEHGGEISNLQCCGLCSGVAECALSENGHTVDPQDGVRWRWSKYIEKS